MGAWAAFCDEGRKEEVRAVVRALDEGGDVVFASSADALRSFVLGSVPGDVGVVVGPSSVGVADVNLAAAIARDDSARTVVLLGEGVTGSLRSRAARAGVDRVVDVAELRGGRGEEGTGAGRSSRPAAPLPSPATEGDAVGSGHEGERREAPVLTFCSGRGGVGKTSVVALAAAHAASWGMSVCALDLDLSCGNLYAAFGLAGGSDLARMDEVATSGAWGVEGLCLLAAPGVHVAGPCDRPEAAELAMDHAGTLIRSARKAFDLVLVDTSTTFTDAVAQAAQLSDRLVIVSDGRPGALSSLARAGGLAVRLGVARTRIARLENRASQRGRPSPSFARAELGLEAARVYCCFEGGEEARECLAEGGAVSLAESGLPFPSSVAAMLAQMLAELGRLPNCREAERALGAERRRQRVRLFRREREAI